MNVPVQVRKGENFLKTTKPYRDHFFPNDLELEKAEYKYLPECSFRDTEIISKIIADDRALLDWILDLETTGIHFITDASSPKTLQRISKRVAYLRKTTYGEVFHVQVKYDANNVAFTNVALAMHTDLAFNDNVPGMQMLHCISQTPIKGGDNIFADGFKIASHMKEKYPHHYSTLTSVPVNFFDDDNSTFYLWSVKPTFRLDSKGEVNHVGYSSHGRHSSLDIPLSQVQPLFEALKVFDDLCYHPDFCIRHKLQPGEIVCFHNFRILHGRDSYENTGNVERHLEGGYIDWDELKSMRRVLQARLVKAHMMRNAERD